MYRVSEESAGNDESNVLMSWANSVKISFILTLAQVFIAFLTLYDWYKIMSDPPSFLFDLFKFSGASFFGTFIAITGLRKYFNR